MRLGFLLCGNRTCGIYFCSFQVIFYRVIVSKRTVVIQFIRIYLFGEQDSLTAARFLADCCGKAQRGNRRMDTKFAKSAYWNFLLWGMCSSLSVTLSTIIDATLVGNFVGSSGLAVSNLATPVYLLYALFGLTLGMGSSVLIGGKLGASDVEGANDLFHQVLTAGLVLGLACMVLVLAFRSSLCRFLGAEGELLALAQPYLTVVFTAAPVFILYHILNLCVCTDGAPKLAAAASAVVIAVNLGLDLLFMAVLRWGIVGASAALCIGEGLGLVVLLTHFTRKNALLKLRLKRPRRESLKGFVGNGFGVGSSQIFQALVMLVFNTLLLADGEDGVTHVAIFGVIYTMSTVPQAVFDGAGSAMTTVVSIFTGERDDEGILTVLKLGLKIVCAAGAVIAAGFLLGAERILCFFGLEGDSIPQAVNAFRIYSVSVIFMGVNALAVSFWQSIGWAKLAAWMSAARNFVLMLALGVLLIPGMSITGLGLTYVCSEAVCLLAAAVLLGGSAAYVRKKYRMTGAVFERYYTIQTESVTQIAADLEQLCEEWEIGPQQTFFINLMAEELLINIIKFGLTDSQKEYYIAIRVMKQDSGEDGYIMRIRDNVNSYNPFEHRGDDIDNAVIRMIRTKTRYYDYQRKLIFNYLYLIL